LGYQVRHDWDQSTPEPGARNGRTVPWYTPSERPLEDRLSSWKEIAAYLKRDVTTVQRWEMREGMPVHRQVHDRMDSVYVVRTELDSWVYRRNLLAEPANVDNDPLPDPPAQPPPQQAASNPRSLVRFVWPLDAAVVAIALAAIWLHRTEYFWRSLIAGAKFHLVTFWVRKPNSPGAGDIGIWAVSTLGGARRPYLEGVAEFEWSRGGSRRSYHTPGPGDPPKAFSYPNCCRGSGAGITS
jgi:hypothetical protein